MPSESSAAIREQPIRPYPEYTPVADDWIKQIPSHWRRERLKNIASIQTSNVDKKSEEGEIPVRLCNYVDVYYNDTIDADLDFMNATATPEEIRKFSLRVDDVLITKDSESWDDIAVPAHVHHAEADVLCGYHLAQIRPTKGELSGAFLARAFSAAGLRNQFWVAATGITRYGLSRRWIDDAEFPVPPLGEQEKIAAFLDRETGKIDGLVAKKKELIRLLQEKRTALITHAVTKGLDPNAPMKDSGIEWLGEIPAHWGVNRLSRLTPPTRKIMYGIVLPGPHVDNGVPIVKGGDVAPGRLALERLNRTTHEIESSYKRSRLRGGDLVFAIRGSIGDVEIVPDELEGANVTQDAARISPIAEVDKEWLLFALRAGPTFAQLESGALGATIRGINIRDLKRAMLPIPPRSEKERIAEHLIEESSKFDLLIASVEAGIDHLQELRTALISAAVTGKIDVRETSP